MKTKFIGSPKSAIRYNTIKFICVECLKELRLPYNDNYFYSKAESLNFCECCESTKNNILERF